MSVQVRVRPTRRELAACGILVMLTAAAVVSAWYNAQAEPSRIRIVHAQSPSRHVDLRVPVNTATVAELMTLPGIGRVRAEAIVADRNRRGRFTCVDSLQRIRGIGPITIERLRERVTVRMQSR